MLKIVSAGYESPYCLSAVYSHNHYNLQGAQQTTSIAEIWGFATRYKAFPFRYMCSFYAGEILYFGFSRYPCHRHFRPSTIRPFVIQYKSPQGFASPRV